MSDETTLLPCPFCGGEAHMSASSDGYGVQCWNRRCMDIQMEEIPTEAEAIAAWNSRAYLNPDGLPMGLTISDNGELLNWRGENYVKQGTLGNGTLTAEQVREAIEHHGIASLGCRWQFTDRNWQAIADELNALLGSEPSYDELLRCLENDWNIRARWDGLRKFWCIELTEEGVWMRDAELGSGTCEQVLADCDDGLMPPFTAHCSACGAEWGFTPKYCHNCGAKVTGTRDERKAVER